MHLKFVDTVNQKIEMKPKSWFIICDSFRDFVPFVQFNPDTAGLFEGSFFWGWGGGGGAIRLPPPPPFIFEEVLTYYHYNLIQLLNNLFKVY